MVSSDSEARRVLEECRRTRQPFPALGLTGGDLCRTLGGTGDRARMESGQGVWFPLDVGEVLLDGRMHLFVAHMVARSRLWARAVVAMNAQAIGDWNVGPRAHPNDGLLDVYEAELPLPERLKVRSRLHHGAHLPHPGIRERRVPAAQFELDRPLPVRLDGERVGVARVIAVRVRPDALVVGV